MITASTDITIATNNSDINDTNKSDILNISNSADTFQNEQISFDSFLYYFINDTAKDITDLANNISEIDNYSQDKLVTSGAEFLSGIGETVINFTKETINNPVKTGENIVDFITNSTNELSSGYKEAKDKGEYLGSLASDAIPYVIGGAVGGAIAKKTINNFLQKTSKLTGKEKEIADIEKSLERLDKNLQTTISGARSGNINPSGYELIVNSIREQRSDLNNKLTLLKKDISSSSGTPKNTSIEGKSGLLIPSAIGIYATSETNLNASTWQNTSTGNTSLAKYINLARRAK